MKKIIPCLLATTVLASAAPKPAKPMKRPAKPEQIEKVKAALPSEAPAKPSKDRKVLVFTRCEGFVHSSIPLGAKAMALLGEKTGAFTIEESMDLEMFTPETLARFDAILFLSTTRLDPLPEQKQALLDFVRSGKGIIGIHAASDNFYQWEEGAKMMGGLFCGHPWTAKCTVQVKLDEPGHPINAVFEGKPFRIQDEIYQFKDPYSRQNQRIITSLDMSDPDTKATKGGKPEKITRTDNDFGITWIRREGKGRVFYCSLGHNEHIFWDNRILQHYLAGIQYALGDYEVPDEIK
ncbi:MAG: ThuA domain-containing protein [Verrucomicrobiota bacterium]|nr:ThuA domain-containing protein [Verrucomicrobiota bacterium]